MKNFPRIETERLVLRRFEMGDAEDVARMAGDWAICEVLHLLPYPYVKGDAEFFIEEMVWGRV